MKSLLFVALLLPVYCFCQHFSPKVQFGGGYIFYTGATSAGNINGDYTKTGLKSGFAVEATLSQRIYKFLQVGLGGSVSKFNHINAYAPLYAEVKVMVGGKLRPYGFVRPGYGIYNGRYNAETFALNNVTIPQRGGFYMSYGAGLVLHAFYIQAAYERLRFETKDPIYAPNIFRASYGIVALTAGVRLPGAYCLKR